jgi:hypothetical protein
MLTGVPAERVPLLWGMVSPFIASALEKSQHDYKLEDVYDCLIKKDMQLWVWNKGDEIVACGVTTITSYPNRKICAMPFVGGTKMREWIKAEPLIIAWAKAQGCTQLEGYCRPGWKKVLPHWGIVWNTMRRSI